MKTSCVHLSVDLLVEASLLQLQLTFRVGHLGVSLEFDVHHLLLTLCFLGEGRSRALIGTTEATSNRHSLCCSLTRIPASLSASATPMSASLWTAAIWVLPRELR